MTIETNTAGTDLQAEIDRLRAENAVLQTARPATSFKVSEKGAISVYGLGRFPVTLYVEQMEKFIELVPQIQQFIKDNAAQLSRKKSG